jgi:hypothetical protein
MRQIDERALHDDAETVLRAYLGTRAATMSLAALAEALGRSLETLHAPLRALEIAGRIEVWAKPEGTCITLTPVEASRQRLRLDQRSRRWCPASIPEPRARRRPRPDTVTFTDLQAD